MKSMFKSIRFMLFSVAVMVLSVASVSAHVTEPVKLFADVRVDTEPMPQEPSFTPTSAFKVIEQRVDAEVVLSLSRTMNESPMKSRPGSVRITFTPLTQSVVTKTTRVPQVI